MKLIILDRDGVINEDSDDYIKSPDEWIAIPGSLEAIARLNRAGVKVAVATNQSGIARKYFSINILELIHDKMTRSLAHVDGHIDTIVFCPHGPDDGCECRKPKAGMLQQIADHFGCDLNGVYVIGDSLRDIQAAQTAGAEGILVRTGKGLRTLAAKPSELDNLAIFDDLSQAVDNLLNNA
ncbi:MAG: D-glycero-beta-D-manno-heptose 1,7-bisphosphate 7-phosphatase [Candidatus Polarisedimenticolaceae bacterium]|nr:D-glycero-beta-D-manno-heptose 1,7-bisphosphate 7-phosphatase [Candidatus Polarisedimenticolaceae bacterium]